MKPLWIFLGLFVSLAVPFGLVAQKEAVRANGTQLWLQLAPVDPRSLIQGDYMRLSYAIVSELRDPWDWPRDGHLVLRRDENGVGQFVRRHQGEPLAPGEMLLRFRKRDGDFIRLGAEAFHFQEGTAERYEAAKYGELRVTPSGAAVLIGLGDAERRPLGP